MDQSITRRTAMGLAAGVGVGLAGCLGSGHDHNLSLRMEENGTSEVVLSLEADGVEFERTIGPGDEEERTIETGLQVEYEYDDELEAKVTWDVSTDRLETKVKQDIWGETSVDVGFSTDEEMASIDGTAEVSLPGESLQAPQSEFEFDDVRPAGDWHYTVEVAVEDAGEKGDLSFDVEQND